ncbi:hypothetical protein HG263_17170 [Pseudoalteromonas sp. JBTF-M23]|uniref:Uncharacterized protein n=1 Tax=Pseudoalteromonas caenipelagi TaxID=2726988 RepID=A0A849VIF9_9GAMM|nr:hypothetical protein [Pseudoalteromonas caenipelagi]NOU52263.1 hypothetical protein [Pseudoalteromonas caenipelagi]
MDKQYEALPKELDKLVQESYEKFSKRATNYSPLHKLSRRSAATASIFVLISASYLIAGLSLFKSTPIGDLKKLGDIVIFDLGNKALVVSIATSFVTFSIYLWLKKWQNSKKEQGSTTYPIQFYQSYFLIISTGISSLLFFEWQQLMPVFFAAGLIIFILSYSINRKFGYTRAWSRNRLYAEKVRLIDARYKSGMIFRDKAHEDLLKLLEQYEEQTHQDTVNDYISYGNSALNTLKGLRK